MATSPPAPPHMLHRRWQFWELRDHDGDAAYEEAMGRLGRPISSVEELWGMLAHLPRPSQLFSAGDRKHGLRVAARSGGHSGSDTGDDASPQLTEAHEERATRESCDEGAAGAASGSSRSDAGSADTAARDALHAQAHGVEALCFFAEGIRPAWEDPANAGGGELFCRRQLDLLHVDACWEALVLAAAGEALDDGLAVTGVRVVDKTTFGAPLYRVELWFNTPVGLKEDPEAEESLGVMSTRVAATLRAALPKSAVPKMKVRSH